MKRIGDIFEIRTGFTFRSAITEIGPGEVAVIQAGDINSAQLSNTTRIAFEGNKHLLQEGDVLLSARGGTAARTVNSDILPAVAASSVIVLRPNADINTNFIARFLNSTSGQAALAKIMSGSYIKTLRKSELKNLIIPTPPTATQQTIVDLGEVIDRQQQALNLKIELLTDIFNQAIKPQGELR